MDVDPMALDAKRRNHVDNKTFDSVLKLTHEHRATAVIAGGRRGSRWFADRRGRGGEDSVWRAGLSAARQQMHSQPGLPVQGRV